MKWMQYINSLTPQVEMKRKISSKIEAKAFRRSMGGKRN